MRRLIQGSMKNALLAGAFFISGFLCRTAVGAEILTKNKRRMAWSTAIPIDPRAGRMRFASKLAPTKSTPAYGLGCRSELAREQTVGRITRAGLCALRTAWMQEVERGRMPKSRAGVRGKHGQGLSRKKTVAPTKSHAALLCLELCFLMSSSEISAHAECPFQEAEEPRVLFAKRKAGWQGRAFWLLFGGGLPSFGKVTRPRGRNMESTRKPQRRKNTGSEAAGL
ncbi:hypothetical protein H681_08575 [Pseudomonas sp. ATCC 13867]|nr:hypothetical protein H681_08575 [Pseudomonas sp. ATCC 13867]